MSREPAMQKPTPEQCATELMETIHPIVQFIRAEMRRQRESSLSVPQFRVLAFLHRHPQASLSDVAEHMGITRATASAMTDRLVQRGLIDRAEDPQERRQVMLKLTLAGDKQLEQMRNRTRETIARVFHNLTAEELAQISTGLTILSRVFT